MVVRRTILRPLFAPINLLPCQQELWVPDVMGLFAGRSTAFAGGLSGTLTLVSLVVAISVWVWVVPLVTLPLWDRRGVERSSESPHYVWQFIESACLISLVLASWNMSAALGLVS